MYSNTKSIILPWLEIISMRSPQSCDTFKMMGLFFKSMVDDFLPILTHFLPILPPQRAWFITCAYMIHSKNVLKCVRQKNYCFGFYPLTTQHIIIANS